MKAVLFDLDGTLLNEKKEIVYASDHWLGVNSASILEAIVDLYRTTGEKRYLDFASYIVSTGGIQGEGNLIELALAGEKMPYEYPEVKAYETMSFFEGVLAYYEVTGERRYFDAAIRFFEAVAKTDVTVIGCSGCTHELFDRSAVRQIEYSDIIMQETCVTVTWMRVMAKLYLLTGEKKYVDRIETSALNALYGAVNTRMEKQYSQYLKIWLDPFPFDSYSPLYNNKRGVGVGGYKEFAFGGGYGCCACIASAGTALYPLCAAVGDGGAAIVNFFLPGEMNFKVGGEEVGLIAETSYPVAMDWEATVKVKKSVRFALKIRKPDFLCGAVVRVNGEDFSAAEEGGYLLIERDFSDGDRVSLSGAFGLETLRVGRRTAFRFGPLVLARDAEKEDGEVDLAETFSLAAEGGAPLFRFAPPQGEETLRLLVRRGDGGELLLTDYASCGKKWRGEKQRMTVWMNIEDPA